MREQICLNANPNQETGWGRMAEGGTTWVLGKLRNWNSSTGDLA